MAGPRLISIIGRKNAGKTTLTVALAAEFVRRGKRVMTIKHGHHAASVDTEGTDSWRHFQEGKAERVLLAGPEGRVLFDRVPDLYDPVALARQYLADADVILVEGFKRAPVPKIEVWRRAVAPAPIYSETAPERDLWVALLTDDETFRASCRVIHFRDTMWLHLLATLAWDEGLELDGVTAPLGAREAALRILDDVRPQPALRVPLDDALGSVLADDVSSPLDIPAWTNSAMDGYATRADDVRGASDAAPVRLRVVEEIPAGHFPLKSVGPGECARIFTGAPLPGGSDGVVRQEDTDEGRDVVTIFKDRDAGANLRHVGEDVRRGTVVLQRGALLGPAELGVLASLAVAHPLVHRRPRVAIMGSGDEIVDVDQPEEILSGRKIASSNTHTLVALVRLAGGEPVNLGVARDTRESFREHLAAAREADLLVTTAGISVGEHDYVRPVLEEMGATQKFWKLRMRPGAPVGFGLLGDVPWIGLPGNPVSTMVTFELFVRPAIRKMCGHALPFRRSVQATMAEPVTLKPKLQHFLRAVLTEGPHGLEARLTGPQGSGILTSMVKANALLVIPEGQFETPAGSAVTAILLDDPRNQAEPAF